MSRSQIALSIMLIIMSCFFLARLIVQIFEDNRRPQRTWALQILREGWTTIQTAPHPNILKSKMNWLRESTLAEYRIIRLKEDAWTF